MVGEKAYGAPVEGHLYVVQAPFVEQLTVVIIGVPEIVVVGNIVEPRFPVVVGGVLGVEQVVDEEPDQYVRDPIVLEVGEEIEVID